MSALDRRLHPTNDVLRHCRRDEVGVSRLVVDKTHPFFFDHPLDHVPGLLLLEGAVQAAQGLATESCFVSSIFADFKQYTFFDKDVLLHTTITQDVDTIVYTTRFEQEGATKATVRVGLSSCDQIGDDSLSSPPLDTGLEVGFTPCTSRALNKQSPENVLITTPVLTDEKVTSRLVPMSKKCMFSDSAQAVHPLYLLEAFMQVQRFLNAHQDGDRRVRDILTGVSFEQTAPIVDLSGGVTIDGAREFVSTGKNRLARSAWLKSGDRVFAKCSIRTAQVATKPKTTIKSETETPQHA